MNIPIRMLMAVVGQPLRYNQLQGLLGDRNDNALTRCLTWLRNEGLLQQRLDLRGQARTYGLTALGKLVLYRVQQMTPHHQSIQAYQRGQAAKA